MKVLVFNAGSSTIKFSLFEVSTDKEAALVDGMIDWTAQAGAATGELTVYGPDGERKEKWTPTAGRLEAGVAEALAALHRLDPPVLGPGSGVGAVGHRVVHGGTTYREPVRIDAQVEAEIERLVALAPLHNPPALAGIRAAATALPGVPQVAVFDTAFHATLPPAAYVYPVPYAWYADWGVRRFGFHGISHAYCADRAAAMLGRPLADLRLVTCHLGNGCSLAAIAGGRSIDTTMGFTPLDGVAMGTRPGALDPGVLIYVLRRPDMTVDTLEEAVTRQSGLLGVSGLSSDMRTLLGAADAGNERARLAVDIFVARVRSGIAAMAAALGGIDGLVFAGGIGEHATTVRAAICAPLGFMGVQLDPVRNTAAHSDAEITGAGGTVRVLVVHTQEDCLIARETARLVDGIQS